MSELKVLPEISAVQFSNTGSVFLIDDDEMLLQSLRWLLEGIGLNVETFSRAGDFLSFVNESHRGCIVSDVRMPGMTGPEMFAQLKARGCELPIIFLTAYGEVITAVEAMKDGAIDFLEKPIDEQTLLRKIKEGLERDQEHRATLTEYREVRTRVDRLTKREYEVAEYVVEGLSSRETGEKLNVSYKTIEAHRTKIMKKMEADNVPQLVQLWLLYRRGPGTPLPPSS